MKKLSDYMLFYIRKHIKAQILAFIVTILYSIAVILSPIASEYLINKVLGNRNMKNIEIGIFIFFISCTMQPIIGFFRDYLFLNIGLKINFNISKNMFNKVIGSSMDFFDKIKSGEIISRINNDGNSISKFISNFFIMYLKDILVIIMILVGMILMSLKITLIILLLLLFNLLANFKFDSKFKKLSLENAKNNDNLYSYVNQVVNSITTIKAFGNEERIKLDYEKILKKSFNDNKKMQTYNIIVTNLNNLIGILSISIIYGLGSIEIIKGKMTIGSVIGLGLYFQLIISPIAEVVNNNIQLSSIKPIFDRVDQFMNLKQEFINNNSIRANKDDRLTISNLCFKYNDSFNVLTDINIEFPEKGLIGIIGESGAGKSTLIKLLLDFYAPVHGKIKIGDNTYSDLGVNNVRKNIGFVDQNVKLFNMSIKDNIRYVNSNISDEEIIKLFKQVNLHNKIMKFKKAYDTVISEKLNLSGGEIQRIGIVMALSKKPNIIILDEPTSALDNANEFKVMTILKKISKERLVIIVSHSDATLKFVDKTYVISNASLLEKEVIRDENLV